ncbi:DUF2798 domain-containing protein [Pseudodonghicola flavimaris]|uniref:DUF2798 domain-containing protein n=1 Tax=Pseudodonghicola flavimaris TaxID=3050036 RepID=A0ABT7F212_9RHOB|nr:DUF2798 domain-containing protein [Pseudodonghicola flavimaris]MDK3018647.1 DUF2798 domain-containing protein [Pseudodonghicola flavimaris]
MDKKSLLLAQVLITFMMALSMSGIMSMIHMGPTREWLATWPREFIIAWPIAFVLTQGVGRIAFFVVHRLRPLT